jgi:hypothetical protein
MTASEPGPTKPGGFVPLLLIALAFITVEAGTVIRSREQMRFVKTQVEQLETASRASQEADAKLQSLLSNLLRLAEVDSDAKAIATKYALRFAPPAPPAGANRQ